MQLMQLAVTTCRCRGNNGFAFMSGENAAEIRGVLDDDLNDFVLFDADHDYPEIVIDGVVLKRQSTLYNGHPWWAAPTGSSGTVFKSVRDAVTWIYNPAGFAEPFAFAAEDGKLIGDGWFELHGTPPRCGVECSLTKGGSYANGDDNTAVPSISVRWPSYRRHEDDGSTDEFVGLFVPRDDDGTLAYSSLLVGTPVYSDGLNLWRLDVISKRLVCSDGRIYSYRRQSGCWILGDEESGWIGPEPNPPNGLTLVPIGIGENIHLSYQGCESDGGEGGECLLFEVSQWR